MFITIKNLCSVGIVLSVMIISTGCKKREPDIRYVKPASVIYDIDGKYFFKNIGCLTSSFKNIFFIDETTKSVFMCDKDLHLVNKISSYGRGPGEMEYPCSFFVDSTGIVNVLDSRVIKRFGSNGQYINDLKIGIPLDFRFCMKDSSYIFSGINRKKATSLRKSTYNGKFKTDFSDLPYKSNNKTQNDCGNYKNVFINEKGEIITVGCYYPQIELFDKDMNRETVYRITHPSFMDTYNYYEKFETDKQDMSFSVVSDSYFFNDKIYMIIFHLYDQKVRLTCNTLLVYSIKNSKIEFENAYTLTGDEGKIGYFSTFCVLSPDTILAFEIFSSSFMTFNL
jgi:hypothetical protein